MNDLPLIVALVLALATAVSVLVHSRLFAALVGLAWLALVGGFVALYAGLIGGPGAAVSIAALAGIATLPVAVREGALRPRMVLAGATVPVALASVGVLAGLGAAVEGTSQLLLLHAAQWATLSGAMTAAVAAAAAPGRGEGLGWVAAATLGGAFIVGAGRPSLTGIGYALPVVGEGGPVFWELSAFRGFEEGLRLAVAHPAPLVGYALAAGAALAALVGIRGLIGPRLGGMAKIGALAWALVAAGAVTGLVGLYLGAAEVALPDTRPFADATRQALASQEANLGALAQAGFTVDAARALELRDVAPDLFGMVLALLLALVGLWGALRGAGGVDHPVARLYGRDHAARAVALAWLAWFLGTLTQISFLGAPGVGAPGEWVALGALLLISGVVTIGWRPAGVLSAAAARASGGVVGAVLLLVVAMAARFGAEFGVSVALF